MFTYVPPLVLYISPVDTFFNETPVELEQIGFLFLFKLRCSVQCWNWRVGQNNRHCSDPGQLVGGEYIKTQLSCILFITLTTTCFGQCGPSSGHKNVYRGKLHRVRS